MDQKKLLKEWVVFYDSLVKNDECLIENLHFESIAVGFFGAHGLTLEESKAMYNLCINIGKF